MKPFAVLLALFLAACANDQFITHPENYNQLPQDDKLRYIADMQDRLDRVAGTLQIGNADLCRNQVRHLLGFAATNKYSYSPRMTSTASQVFGLGERLQITSVITGSGAEQAGLQRGDILVTIEGKPVPQGPAAESETVKMLSPIVAKNSAVQITIERNGARHALTVPLTRACGFRVELGHTDQVNAYSDGQRILITRGMMRFTQNDSELAYVIGKEMAHNVLNHARTLRTTETSRKIIDNLIQVNPKPGNTGKIKPMTRQFDLDSDTLGLAMALRAGYDIDSAVNFWTRLVRAYPASSTGSYTASHPNSRSRLEVMPKAVSRIKAAEKRKKALSRKQ
ncbi:MAG: M48 family metallopeptidase [Oxalobacter formigenes]|nr:M48 family metallopeptidase [Oxalobacter formigenes]